MASTARKILAQANPGAATAANLINVAAGHDFVVSTLVISETNGAAATFRVCVTPAGGAATTVAAANSLAWDMPIAANQTITLTLGITLAATDNMTIRSSTANLTYTAFGQDNTL